MSIETRTEKQKVATAKAPAAIGPYSQAIRVGEMVYTSGMVALDPQTGAVVGDEIEQQTERTIANLRAVLEAAGSSLAKVVKTTVYLKDMHDFGAMNVIYAKHLAAEGAIAPARSTVEVARLPKDVLVEIDAIALVG
jgi:2-iminobutanoate/2-iminopropanoate deaminase